ncbi:MAG: calcium-binding protein [Alphaproteobacteria bacterium]|nr:calcium-binding protein [Alphaproteobacteria bacterium]
MTLTVGTDSFTSFSPGPDIVNLGSVAHLTVVDTITAGVGDAPANADVLQLNTSGVTYTLQGANLPSITGLERIQTGLGGQYTVVVDADFLANNYDSTGRLTVAAAATTAFNQHFTLQGTPASGKFFSVVLPGITSSTNDTVIGSDGSDEVILNGLGTDSVNTGLGADTVFATLAQLSAADTLDGGSGTDTLVLTGGGTVNLGTFSKVTGFEVVRIADNGLSSAGLTLSNAFVTSAGGTVTLEMANISAVPVTFDASALTGSNRVIMTGAAPVLVGITGGAGNDELYGRTQSGDSLNGGAGDDKLYPMLGGTGDFVTMGGGADTVFGTASDLDNLTISDFGSGDVIQITSHAFTGGVMAGTGSSTGMTAFSIRVDTAGNKLYLETSGDSTADATINLSSGGFSGSNFSVTSGTISYVAGPSLAFSATGGETVTGTVGNDTVTAATGTLSAGESINGAGGSDTLHLTGGGGFNLNGVLGLGSIHRIITDNIATSVILPNTGTTRLVLGSGNDSITIGAGTSVNTIWGGAGSDEVTLGGGIMTTLVSNGGLDTGSMLISVSGDPNATIFADGDTITGGSSANIVVVATTAVAPTVISLGGSSGSVTAFVHGTATTVVTGSNSDLLYGGPGSQRFDAGPGSDILIGEAGRDLLLGGADNDMLVGGADGDILVAGSGQNTVWGDAGQDVFVLDTTGVDLITDFVSGVDRINVRAISGAIVDFASLEAEMTATSATNGWSYRLVSTPSIGFDVISATKLTAADFIFGQIGVGAAGAANETINGTSQDDLLLGLDGHDSLFGSAGADTLVAGMGADTLDGGADGDVFVFPAGTNAIIGAAPDVIVGLEASDTIRLGPSSLNLSLSASTTFTVGAVTAGPANGMADVLGLFSGTPGSTNSIVQTRSVTISGGALAGNVYLFINDGAVGGSAGPDMLIRLVGGSLPVASAFTVGEYL